MVNTSDTETAQCTACHSENVAETACTVPSASNCQQRWVTDSAWISGIAGMLTLLLVAYYFHMHAVLTEGLSLFGFTIADRFDAITAAVVFIAAVMTSVEACRLWRYDRHSFFRIDPLLASRQYGEFAMQCVKRYVLLLLLFALAKLFYQSINEYGFHAGHRYYQPWFHVLGLFWNAYLWGGLPYIMLTRACKHSEQSDQKDLATVTEKMLLCTVGRLFTTRFPKKSLDANDRRIVLGLAVKIFFVPIMTVFFFDNFGTLVNNFDYISGGLRNSVASGTYTHALFNQDLANIGPNFIFTIDVGLAWCGYVVSSRWVNNQTISAEPTLAGWAVCLISYPPFRTIPGWLISGPGERTYLQLPNPTLVTLFGLLMVVSYFLYMLPTIWFGVRFSNLTHRGIVRRGPFAVVRHPAYAAKNIGWWCVGLPVALYSGFHGGLAVAGTLTLGLAMMTGIYYLRAVTEERHLSFDPQYREYCQQVKYRFIPGII